MYSLKRSLYLLFELKTWLSTVLRKTVFKLILICPKYSISVVHCDEEVDFLRKLTEVYRA